jgi:hypothetical protein
MHIKNNTKKRLLIRRKNPAEFVQTADTKSRCKHRIPGSRRGDLKAALGDYFVGIQCGNSLEYLVC